jgi:hypothetical protein
MKVMNADHVNSKAPSIQKEPTGSQATGNDHTLVFKWFRFPEVFESRGQASQQRVAPSLPIGGILQVIQLGVRCHDCAARDSSQSELTVAQKEASTFSRQVLLANRKTLSSSFHVTSPEATALPTVAEIS